MNTGAPMPRLGMIGAGQLARMTHQAATSLGLSLRVLAAAPDDAAATVAADVEVGAHTDLAALRRFADGCDVVTFDHEHVPGEALATLAAEGVVLRPGPDALRHAQDKLVMRDRLRALAAPVPSYRRISAAEEIERFGTEHGWPVIAKTPSGGYDGKGVFPLASAGEGAALLDRVGVYLEARVPLVRELAAVVARSPFGQAAAWPVVETVQRDGVCTEVLAPAPGLSEERAQQAQALALRLAADLDVVGVLAVELFETADGLVVNELAMRPHNSAHWTIEGATTSQFAQHVRACLDWTLGPTRMRAPYAVMANVLAGPETDPGLDLPVVLNHHPDVAVHLYGKRPRPGRKIGHVTAVGGDLTALRAAAGAAAAELRGDRA